MTETRRNLHQLLQEKQLFRVYTEVQQDLTAIAKRETAMPTITAPPSIEEFRERRR
jgi:hypothetical protein